MSFRPIWGRPTLIADWNEAQEDRESHWTSLFYDLMIVAACSAIAEPFMEASEGESISEHSTMELGNDDESSGLALIGVSGLIPDAVLLFLVTILPWNFLNEITSLFEDESLAGHLAFFVHALGMAATVAGCVGELEENFITLGVGMIITRVGLIMLHVRPLIYINRAKSHCILRCSQAIVVIVAVLSAIIGIGEEGGTRSTQTFRWVLAGVIVWDLASMMMTLALKCERLPLHISSYSDRMKELTMVIFGEAILAVTLLPRHKGSLNYFIALTLKLWLIYSLALHEYHVSPEVHDHALRRSVVFGSLWVYTQYVKQVFLLGTSIGIKRVHYLLLTEQESVDSDTLKLLVWGMSILLLCVVSIRSYSFGWGRHPSPDTPPNVAAIEITWWMVLLLMCWAPLVVEKTIIQRDPSPVTCLLSLGIMMALIIFGEAVLSNVVALLIGACDKGTLYLRPHKRTYDSIPQE